MKTIGSSHTGQGSKDQQAQTSGPGTGDLWSLVSKTRSPRVALVRKRCHQPAMESWVSEVAEADGGVLYNTFHTTLA